MAIDAPGLPGIHRIKVRQLRRGRPRVTVHTTTPDLSVRLPSEPYSANRARHAVAGGLGLRDPDLRDEVVLLVSELVTNALRHAGGDEDGPIELRAWAPGPCIRVEVCDRGTGFDPQEVEAEAGFGLRLVSVYASRWGVAREDDCTAVWFEIDRRHS